MFYNFLKSSGVSKFRQGIGLSQAIYDDLKRQDKEWWLVKENNSGTIYSLWNKFY